MHSRNKIDSLQLLLCMVRRWSSLSTLWYGSSSLLHDEIVGSILIDLNTMECRLCSITTWTYSHTIATPTNSILSCSDHSISSSHNLHSLMLSLWCWWCATIPTMNTFESCVEDYHTSWLELPLLMTLMLMMPLMMMECRIWIIDESMKWSWFLFRTIPTTMLSLSSLERFHEGMSMTRHIRIDNWLSTCCHTHSNTSRLVSTTISLFLTSICFHT